MNTQIRGYQNKLLGAVAQTDFVTRAAAIQAIEIQKLQFKSDPDR